MRTRNFFLFSTHHDIKMYFLGYKSFTKMMLYSVLCTGVSKYCTDVPLSRAFVDLLYYTRTHKVFTNFNTFHITVKEECFEFPAICIRTNISTSIISFLLGYYTTVDPKRCRLDAWLTNAIAHHQVWPNPRITKIHKYFIKDF